ncbi:MAG: pyroglutamyl-peptidase I [Clostridiales bacterium]|nr:pyroglutamyl-peptidase I [Clostridiales bacterium]MDY4180194.1 pyroglutamyl-peptidase I [Pseudoflavonifractor sp.]
MEDKKVVLIIGSAPFGGDPINPTYELAKLLNGTEYKGYVFRSASFPVSRKLCMPAVEAEIEKWNPSIVIGVGLADNRAMVCMERVALNVADFPIPDNEDYMALNETLDEEGPAAYFSTLPIRACVKALRESGIPSRVSNTAGNFCCNLTMYSALNYIAKKKLDARAGFIHVPYTPEMAASKPEPLPTMSFETMKRAVEIAAKAAIDNDTDISMICGACS